MNLSSRWTIVHPTYKHRVKGTRFFGIWCRWIYTKRNDGAPRYLGIEREREHGTRYCGRSHLRKEKRENCVNVERNPHLSRKTRKITHGNHLKQTGLGEYKACGTWRRHLQTKVQKLQLRSAGRRWYLWTEEREERAAFLDCGRRHLPLV